MPLRLRAHATPATAAHGRDAHATVECALQSVEPELHRLYGSTWVGTAEKYL